MTTILIKKKDTAGAPAAGDLTNAAGGAEIAVNTATKRIYSKDSGGTIIEMGTFPSSMAVQGALSATGATNLNGNVTLGDASADNITVTGTITSNLLFTDATYDIGASGASRPRDLFLSRNLTVGGTMTVTGGINFNGNVTVGDSSSDTLTINSTITSNLIFTDNTYDIGASGATRPRNLYLAGLLTMGGALTVNGNTTLGDASADTVTVNGTITSNLIFTDNTYDIGASGATRPRNLYLAGNAVVGGSTTLSGGTANGVVYLNGSKVLTTGSTLSFDGVSFTNNAAASTWFSGAGVIEVGGSSSSYFISSGVSSGYLGFNYSSPSGGTVTRKNAGYAGEIGFTNSAGRFVFNTMGTGSAGSSTSTITQLLGIESATGNMILTNVSGTSPVAAASSSTYVNFQIGQSSTFVGRTDANYFWIGQNWTFNSGDKYIVTDKASLYGQQVGNHIWWTAPSGTAGSGITFAQVMTLNQNAAGTAARLAINGGYSSNAALAVANPLGDAYVAAFDSAPSGTNTYARIVLNGGSGGGADVIFASGGVSRWGIYTNDGASGAGSQSLGVYYADAATAAMKFDTSSRVTVPLNPTFVAKGGGNITSGTLPYDSTLTNIGGNYNSSTYTFTAPVNGIYAFAWQFWQSPGTAAAVDFKINNVVYSRFGPEASASSDYFGLSGSIIVYLAANDTAKIDWFKGTVHLNSNYSYFSGRLIG